MGLVRRIRFIYSIPARTDFFSARPDKEWSLTDCISFVVMNERGMQGERGRLVIGTLGPLTSPFLPQALARFHEQHPMVEATALHMSNPLQIESLLEGSIMLGIGYFDLPLETSTNFRIVGTAWDCFFQRATISIWPASSASR